MKVLATKKSEFTSKKNGVSYVKISYVSSDGSEGMFMAEKSEFAKMGFPDDKILGTSELNTVFTKLADFAVDIEFNSFGRVIGVK